MTKLRNLLVVCALAAPLFAGGQEDVRPAAPQSEHEQHASPPSEAQGGERSMAAMHEHMAMMRGQMARIHATDDPAERQRLMQEHMQSMQQHMQMMGSMRSGHRAGGPSRCAAGDTSCRMDEMRTENGMMRERMGMMEDRLESMQQLMREMMDHLEVAQHDGSGPQ